MHNDEVHPIDVICVDSAVVEVGIGAPGLSGDRGGHGSVNPWCIMVGVDADSKVVI